MAGIFGIVSKEDCVKDLFWGTFYLQHRAQDYCGLALYDGENLKDYSHKGLLRQQFSKERLKGIRGVSGIGCVAGDREPVSELSLTGGMAICFDGNILNCEQMKKELLAEGCSFSGYRTPEEVQDVEILSKIIAQEKSFERGIEKIVDSMQGDFAITALAREGVYAARGWGRKPLIIGRKDGSYAVSSESNSFPNNGINIVRDVEPGEVVLLDSGGIHSLKKFQLKPIKFGTFEWIYTAHPASVIDGQNVADVRVRIGAALAKRYPVDADLISPIPNSGRWHATGYAQESGIKYEEVFVRYDYSDRSYTPQEQGARDEEARTKLIPIESRIKGKKIIVVDDSIVRGTQMLNRVKSLRELGAKEVHLRIACPPLMSACKYGKTTKKNEDCIARGMSVEQIKKDLGVDSLKYALVDDFEDAIGINREKLCVDCWNV